MAEFTRLHRDGVVRRVLAVALVAGLVVTSAVASGSFVASDATSAEPGGDAPDERSNATVVSPGDSVQGNISDGDDVDWYAVDATAGEAILPWLVLKNNTGGRGLSVSLYAPDGEELGERTADKMSGLSSVAGEGPRGRQDARAVSPDVVEANGTYYVAVRENPWNQTDDNVSSPYNLTVVTRSLDQHDDNENASTATTMEPGQSVEGVVAAYDHDVFAVNLTAGVNYTVTFTHLEEDSADTYLKEVRLFEDPANVTDDTTPSSPGGPIVIERGGDDEGTFTAQRSGIHYLRVGQSSNTAELTNLDPYRMTLVVEESSSSSDANGTATDGTDDGSTPTPTAGATASPSPRGSPTGHDADPATDDPGDESRGECVI